LKGVGSAPTVILATDIRCRSGNHGVFSPGAIGFDGGHEIAWCMPRGPLSSLIQQQTLVANDDNYALAA